MAEVPSTASAIAVSSLPAGRGLSEGQGRREIPEAQ